MQSAAGERLSLERGTCFVKLTPKRTPPCAEPGAGEGSSTTKENESSVRAARAKKGKGRLVLAREKRRIMAVQAARLQEQQLLEAKVSTTKIVRMLDPAPLGSWPVRV